MAEKKKVQLADGWYEQGENGRWIKTTAPADIKTATAPLEPGVDFPTRAKRFVRDLTLPQIGIAVPPMHAVEVIKSLVSGGQVPSPIVDIPVGGGTVRSALTGLGGVAGAGAAGMAGLPSGPGAIAAAGAGYTGGSALGSIVGQYLEKLAPNIFQSGYAPEKLGTAPTEPSIGNTVSDVVINAVGDALTGGAAKGLNLGTKMATKEGRAAIAERMMTRPYSQSAKHPIAPPMDAEQVGALNATPNVPTSTGQVLDENSIFNLAQQLLAPEATSAAIKNQEKALYRETVDFVNKVGGPNIKPAEVTPSGLGKRGFDNAQEMRERATKAETAAYTDVSKYAGKYQPPPKVESKPTSILGPNGKPFTIDIVTESTPVIGPIKLTRSAAANDKLGTELDTIIGEVNDKVLSANLQLVRDRMAALGGDNVKSYQGVREIEKALNELAFDDRLSASTRQQLGEVRATLIADIENNLGGKVAETAGYWKKGALDTYKKAKGITQKKLDVFNSKTEALLREVGGEDLNRPGARGGTYDKMYKSIMDSEQEAVRLMKLGGKDEARTAFVSQFLEKYTDHETGRILGNNALKDLDSAAVRPIAARLLNAQERQKLRNLLIRSQEMNPHLAKTGQTSMAFAKQNVAFNLPVEGFNAVTQGKFRGLLGSAIKISGYMGGKDFVHNYMLNDQFARRVANAMGKDAKRPGMSQEIGMILKTLQGVKLVVQADNGKRWLWDKDENTMTEISPQAQR